jgi:hypothetical protein
MPYRTRKSIRGDRLPGHLKARAVELFRPAGDAEAWLRGHVFWVTNQGWLSRRKGHPVPVRGG